MADIAPPEPAEAERVLIILLPQRGAVKVDDLTRQEAIATVKALAAQADLAEREHQAVLRNWRACIDAREARPLARLRYWWRHSAMARRFRAPQ